jgi:thiamine pyrophosphokinase
MGHDRHRVALVFAGGDPPAARLLEGVSDDALVVAADSGLRHAQALGRRVDLVVGDLDSVDARALAEAEDAGTAVERHPVDKDATDLELAVLAARDRGCAQVIVIGGTGGRLDHFLANALALASDELAGLRIEARMGTATVHVVRDALAFAAPPGSLVTLLPVGGPAHRVVTENLRFPLSDESLLAGSTRGVSNHVVASPARVTVGDGVLLVILPHDRKGRP